MDRKLDVEIKGDNSGWRAAVADSERLAKRLEGEQIRAASAAAEGQKTALAKVRGEGQKTTEALVGGSKKWGASLTEVYSAVGLIRTGFGDLISLARQYGDAMEAAATRRRELTKSFTDERDRLRSLATVMDTVSNTKFTQQHVAFQAKTGMTPAEAMDFREGFQNAGSQFKGARISDKEYAQAELQAGQVAAAKGLPGEQFGELAARVMGMKDRTAMGDAASENVVGDAYRAAMILQHGNGRAGVLNTQFSLVAASMQNEDAMRGTFQTPDQVASAVSVMAESHDARAAEMVRAANRGIRGFDDKDAGPLLRAAKVTPQTSFEDALKQITPIIQKEVTTKGVKFEDVLSHYFPEQLTREAIGVGINKGVLGGLFDERAAYAKTFAGDAPAFDAVRSATSDPDQGIQLRQAEAEKRLEEMKKGAQDARLATIRAQAEGQMEATGQTGTTASFFGDMQLRLENPLADPRRIRTDQNMLEIIRERGQKAGIDYGPGERKLPPRNPDLARDFLMEEAGRVERAGGDPYQGDGRLPGGQGNIGQDAGLKLDAILDALRQQTELMKKQQSGVPAPVVRPGPAPVGRRN